MNFFLLASCLFLFYINVIAAEGSKTPTVSTTPSTTATTTTTTTTRSSSSKKLTNFKETEKLSYPKKVNSIKKGHGKSSRKKMADITDKFKDLPDDDLAFIKELDKQFKLHGGKVKIKVENKNVTQTKNSKRTIDGELGYGYAHNGYHYDAPKFMFYPYSQQDIGRDAPGYYPLGDGRTEVSIQPSYSYELKSQTYVTQNQPQIDVPKVQQQNGHAETQQHYEEPVIVLRIPGPAKYATHLQMLLQKYLEIRASQYLHILEEAEHANIQQQQQKLQHLDYGHAHNEHVEQQQQHVQAAPEQHSYVQQVEYSHQNVGSSQAHQYPEIAHVYHSYKNRHSAQQAQSQAAVQQPEAYYDSQQNSEEEQQQHQPQYPEQQQYSPQDHYHYQQQPIQQQPQFYYTHQQQYAQPEGPPANSYHQVLLVTMTQPQQADETSAEHDQAAEKPYEPIYVQEQKESPLTVPIAENNPRPSHTKVVFTNKNEHAAHDYQMYPLPSIKPNERHAPTSTPDFHQDFHQQQESLSHYQPQYAVAAQETAIAAAHPLVVAITQRPYNYHAHNVKARARGRTGHSRRAVTAKEAEQDLQKIREYVRDKLGAETGSAVEFKTTQIIDG